MVNAQPDEGTFRMSATSDNKKPEPGQTKTIPLKPGEEDNGKMLPSGRIETDPVIYQEELNIWYDGIFRERGE